MTNEQIDWVKKFLRESDASMFKDEKPKDMDEENEHKYHFQFGLLCCFVDWLEQQGEVVG